MAKPFGIELKGYNRVANKFRWLASKSPELIDDDIGEFAKRQRRRLKNARYPNKRAGQTYVRTGRLANGWKAVKRAKGQHAIINSTPYARYVVGRDDQAWMHVKRWWIFEEEMEKATPELTKELTKSLIDGWDSAG